MGEVSPTASGRNGLDLGPACDNALPSENAVSGECGMNPGAGSEPQDNSQMKKNLTNAERQGEACSHGTTASPFKLPSRLIYGLTSCF